MRAGVSFTVSAAGRHRFEAVIAECNASQKHVWHWWIVAGTARVPDTNAMVREAGVAKTALWHWQERFMGLGPMTP